jgi:hypothetical protein
MTHIGPAAPAAAADPDSRGGVAALIAGVAAAAAATFAAVAIPAAHAIGDHPTGFAGFLIATVVLQMKVIDVPEEGAVSFASIGMLGTAFALGTGPAILVAAAAGIARFVAARGRLDRAIFDVGALALASATAAGTFQLVAALDQQADDRFGPSLFAAAAYFIVNVGLVSIAMGMSEGDSPFQIWKRRFRWMTPWALAAGPFAAVVVVAWEQIGVVGIVALAVAPWALMSPVRKRTLWK